MSIPETFEQSLWHATSPPAPDFAPLDGDRSTEVAIVGAGLFGLSTALHLAEAGVRTTVLEAREPGYGASGRSGGLVVPAFTRWGPGEVRVRLGEEKGAELCRRVGAGADLLFDLVRRHSIACEAVQAGWINPAHAPNRVGPLKERVREWQALGRPVRWLDGAETAEATGSKAFRGALFDPAGGHLNPLAYVRGLARAAAKAGADVHVATPALCVSREAGEWRVGTPRASVRARRLVIATNAAPSSPTPALARTAVPLHVFQMATESIDPDAVPTVIPGNAALSDTRHNLFAVRWTAQRRLVVGGMATFHVGAIERLRPRLERRIGQVFPQLSGTRIAQAWHGRASLAPDLLPHMFALGDGGYAAVACNGRGIVMTTMLGGALARHLVSGRADDLPLPLTEPRPIGGYALASLLPRILLPLGTLRDRLDERGGIP